MLQPTKGSLIKTDPGFEQKKRHVSNANLLQACQQKKQQ